MRQALGPGALGRPRRIGWRGRWEEGSGWGTHVNPWLFHSMYDKIHYNIKNKKKCIWKGRRTRIAKKSFVKEISVYNFKIKKTN